MALADGERTRGLLSAAGFLDVELEARDVSILVGTDVEDAVKFSIAAGPLARAIAELPAEDVERLRAALTDALSARKGPQGIALNAAIWCVSGRTKGP